MLARRASRSRAAEYLDNPPETAELVRLVHTYRRALRNRW
jgi:hypothetical protein